MEMDQKKFLAIDQGNSFLKLTLFVGDKLEDSCRLDTSSAEEIFSVIERWKPNCGAFCSVGKIDSRMVESMRLAVGGRFLVMSRFSRLPINIEYSTPSTLGLDRLALAVGAAGLYKDECVAVVDAGTAVTLDVVDEKHTFRGGRITAGLRLRMEALHSHTEALPLVSIHGDLPEIGFSTETAIRSGVIMGLSDEITETFNQYNKIFGCRKLVLTGGDAGLLASCIASRIPADHVPDLMARGLLYIYNYNEI